MKCFLGVSNFLEEISSLSHSVVFLYFFALMAEEGFLVSSCYSLELCIKMLLSFLFSFAFQFSVDLIGGLEVKASACNAEDLSSIPGLGRSPGEGNGNPLQYSCLENPMDRGAWWATVHGVAKSWTRLSDFTSLFTSLLFRAFRKASPDSHFAFLHFFSLEMVLIPVSCTTP